MLTRQVMRKVVAIAAVVGLIAGVYIFVASFFGLTMDKLGGRVLLLHAGIFALAIPLVVVERASKGVSPFHGKPRWALRSMQILFLFFIAVFFAFLSLSHAASPKIVDGEYVLDNHGNIIGHLSEADYFFLKGWDRFIIA